MTRLELDHLYRETHDWGPSVAFWQRIGFRFAEQWGDPPHRAGRFIQGAAEIVLAEVPSDEEIAATAFLVTDALDDLATVSDTHIERTHWGTTMITVTDPDGRRYHIEQEESG